MMKKRYVVILLFLISCSISYAQDKEDDYMVVVERFVNQVKNKEINRLKKAVRYPLRRQHPITNIDNAAEFEKRYDQVFDKALIDIIVNSELKNDWSPMGWRGIMLHSGTIWLSYDGDLIAVNYQSDWEKKKRKELIKEEKRAVHWSLKKFEAPILILTTAKFRVRIDRLRRGVYRYASWPIKKKMTEKPDLILKNGELIAEGSGGNHHYKFVNGKYSYYCIITVMGRDDAPPASLKVMKGNKELLLQPATIVGEQ